MTSSRHERLRIWSFIDETRWFRSYVTIGFTYSTGTIGFATSTNVCEVYFLGSFRAASTPATPQTMIQTGMTHHFLRITLLTSAKANSPFRTIQCSPQKTAYTIPHCVMHAPCHESNRPLCRQRRVTPCNYNSLRTAPPSSLSTTSTSSRKWKFSIHFIPLFGLCL